MCAENTARQAAPADHGREEKRSAASRVASLPLVSSACAAAAAAYARAEQRHPYVGALCAAAAKGARTLTAAAATGARPVLAKLEPRIATANRFACKGLDKLEEKLPILQQPSEKVNPHRQSGGRGCPSPGRATGKSRPRAAAPRGDGMLGPAAVLPSARAVPAPGGGGDQDAGVVGRDGRQGSGERRGGHGPGRRAGRRGEDPRGAERRRRHRRGLASGQDGGDGSGDGAGQVGGAAGSLPAHDGRGAGQADRGRAGLRDGPGGAAAELRGAPRLALGQAAAPSPAALAGRAAERPPLAGPAPAHPPAGRTREAGHGGEAAGCPPVPAPLVAAAGPERGRGGRAGSAGRQPATAKRLGRRRFPARCLAGGGGRAAVARALAAGGLRPGHGGPRAGGAGHRLPHPLLPRPVGPGGGAEPPADDAGPGDHRRAARLRGAARAPALARGSLRPRPRRVPRGQPRGHGQVGRLPGHRWQPPGARLAASLQRALSDGGRPGARPLPGCGDELPKRPLGTAKLVPAARWTLGAGAGSLRAWRLARGRR